MPETICYGPRQLALNYGFAFFGKPSPGSDGTVTESPQGSANNEPCEQPPPASQESLEQVQIKWQRSWQFRIIEWLKGLAAVAAIAAIIGVIVISYFNSKQLDQLAVSRDDEWFDKAISRLGAQSAAERLTGLTGIQLFLDSSQIARRRAALLFLVNAVAVEKDVTIRSAILDVFSRLRNYGLQKEVLDEALIAARDRNRALLKTFFQRRAPVGVRPQGHVESGLLDAGIGNVSPEDSDLLLATAATISSLVQSGASVSDLSHIYCVFCDFSSKDHSIDIKRDRAPIGAWLDALDARAPKNVVVVARANKLARIAWAVLSSGNEYRPAAA
jgi:hypothetical protein